MKLLRHSKFIKKFINCGWKYNTLWKLAIVMKFSIVLTFVFSFELLASVGFSQKINIDLTDASLHEVFSELKKQTNTYFMYSESLIDNDLRIDLKASNKSLQEVLEEICSKYHFTYEVVDDFVLIKKIESEKEQVQDYKNKIKITGVISDVEGIPLPGATIHIKGTTTGTITDIDGVFEMMISDDLNGVLVISSMGFIKQEINIKGRSNFNFTLEEDNLSLNEVVITGYQQIKSERATGSYSILNEETMDNQVTANIVNKMEGVLPGVLVNEDNTFEIRGVSTLYGNDQPLFVIDGVPVETDLSKINPEDIEQITVLKDAASAAIYGVRASNGVIVIKTKNGTKGDKIKVNFSSFFTIGTKYDLGDYQAASSSSIIDAELEYFDKYLDYNLTNSNIDNKYYPYTKVYDIYRQQRDGLISESEANSSYAALGEVDHTKQFQDLFLQNSFDQNYSLSLSGAGERDDYYFSVGYVDAKSGFKGINNDRLTLNLKNDYKMAKWLKIGVNAYATITNSTNNSVVGEYMQRKPYEMILDSDGNDIAQYKDYSMQGKEQLANQGYLDWDYNVLNDLNTRDNTSEGINFRFSAYAKFTILEGLDFTTSYYGEIDRHDLNQFNKQESYYATNLINIATVIDPDGNLVNNIPLGNIAYSTQTRTNAYTFRNQLDYNKTFGNHSITVLAGNEIRQNDINTFQDKKYGFDPQTLQYAYITDPGSYFGTIGFNGDPLRLNAVDYFYDIYSAYLGRDVSYYGNFSWLYDSRYSLTGSVRLDQSNLFGVDKRLKSNPLWSLGGLWNVQNEAFFKSKKINRLTLKVSYGITGNVKRDLLTEATAISSTNRLGEFYLQPVSAQNDGIGHESTANFNVAVLIRLFNRLSINVDYFSKNSYDLLGQIPIDYTLGWNRAWANYASVSTNGIELAVNWTALSKDDITLNIGMNFSYINNNVKEVINTTDVSTYFAGRFRPSPLEGYPVNSLFAYRSGGVDENGEGIVRSKVGRPYPARSVSVLTADDLRFMGSATPAFYGGITTNLKYKQFTLDLLFTYKGGHKSRMPHPLYLQGYGISSNTHRSIADRWMEPGDEDIPGILPALKPETVYYSNQDYGMFHTDKRVFDAGFIRFRKASLAYNFEIKKTNNPIPIQVYGEVRNIGILARNRLGIDPDYIDPYTGILRLSEPTSFVFGLRASF